MRKNKSQEKFLFNCGATFENLNQLADFKTRIDSQGYTETRLTEGETMYDEAVVLYSDHLDMVLESGAKGREVQDQLSVMLNTYTTIAERIRSEYEDDDKMLAGLGLYGKTPRYRASFIEQARRFYSKSINKADYAQKITLIGILPEKLQAELDALPGFQSLCREYEKLKGECQRLVVERDKAVKKLRKWMKAFVTTCRYEFKDNPQAMEAIKIFVRNGPKPRPDEEPAGDTGTGDDTADTTEPPVDTEPPATEPPAPTGTESAAAKKSRSKTRKR